MMSLLQKICYSVQIQKSSRLITFNLAMALVIMCIAVASAADTPPTPLSVAKSLGDGQFRDWTHGEKAAEKQVDCVQFVLAVVEKLNGSAVGQPTRRRILISDVAVTELQDLVNTGDTKIKGVAAAIPAAHLGEEVIPAQAKSGDFVQYWYKEDGKWVGHCGVISKLENGMATIYGAHYKTLQREKHLPKADRKGGVGDGPVFNLTDEARKVYVVRWKNT